MKFNVRIALLGLLIFYCQIAKPIAQPIVYAEDYPIVLPGYFQDGLRFGITGTLILRLHFEDAKVVRIEDVFSDLRSAGEEERNAVFVRTFRNQIRHAYRHWITVFRVPFTAEIETVFQIDPALKKYERIYRVTYGDDKGMITKVEVTGPDIRQQEQ